MAPTSVNFEQPVVEVRYQIPALGLDREIVGNVSGQIEIIDRASGNRLMKRDQAGVILQLQQILPQVDMETPPEDCRLCVLLDFELPMANQSGSGWLQNIQLLASLENYTAANIGPHFPPGTVFGLRRSATPYYAAHTVAITSDGLVWNWTAIEDQISDGRPTPPFDTEILTALEELVQEDIKANYAAACPDGSGVETLRLNLGDLDQSIQLICPELALPASLEPIYVELLSMANESIEDEQLEKPGSDITVDTVVHMSRQDGLMMNVLSDNQVTIANSDGITATGVISSSLALSLTEQLASSVDLQQGVDDYLNGTSSNTLIFRGFDSLYEANWDDMMPESLVSVVRLLETIASTLLDKGSDDVTPDE